MLKQNNVRNWDQIVLMRPTEIVRRERAISGKNESRALIFLGYVKLKIIKIVQ